MNEKQYEPEIIWGAYTVKSISPKGDHICISKRPSEHRKTMASRIALIRSDGALVYHDKEAVAVYMPHESELGKDIINRFILINWSIDGGFAWFSQLDKMGVAELILVNLPNRLYYSVKTEPILGLLTDEGISQIDSTSIQVALSSSENRPLNTPQDSISSLWDQVFSKWYIRNIGQVETF